MWRNSSSFLTGWAGTTLLLVPAFIWGWMTRLSAVISPRVIFFPWSSWLILSFIWMVPFRSGINKEESQVSSSSPLWNTYLNNSSDHQLNPRYPQILRSSSLVLSPNPNPSGRRGQLPALPWPPETPAPPWLLELVTAWDAPSGRRGVTSRPCPCLCVCFAPRDLVFPHFSFCSHLVFLYLVP